MKSLHELFIDGLKDMYNAEKQLTKALPKMAKMAKNPELKEGFQNHLRQTEEHVRRVEQACQAMGEKPSGMVCQAMLGLVKEASEHMGELKASSCADAELIALAQKVEHYEIGSYGTLCTWAELMGHNEALELLKQNLTEEEQTDQLLTQIAEGQVNQAAAEENQQMQMEQQQGGMKGKGRGRSSTGRGRASTGGRGSSGGTSRSKSGGSSRGRSSTGRTSTTGRGGGRSTSGTSRGRSTSARSGSETHSRGGASSRGGGRSSGGSRGGTRGRGRGASAR